jgi:hypothetical protein
MRDMSFLRRTLHFSALGRLLPKQKIQDWPDEWQQQHKNNPENLVPGIGWTVDDQENHIDVEDENEKAE